jgi:hypothetical protein
MVSAEAGVICVATVAGPLAAISGWLAIEV